MTKEDFKDEVCNRMSVFINCSGSELLSRREVLRDLRRHGRDASRSTTNDNFKDEGAFDFGDANDIVVVRAYYQWPTNPIFGGLSLKNLSNGKRLIGSFAAFCNEPSPATASTERMRK